MHLFLYWLFDNQIAPYIQHCISYNVEYITFSLKHLLQRDYFNANDCRIQDGMDKSSMNAPLVEYCSIHCYMLWRQETISFGLKLKDSSEDVRKLLRMMKRNHICMNRL